MRAGGKRREFDAGEGVVHWRTAVFGSSAGWTRRLFRITTSTRRLRARPSGVSLESMGSVSARPTTEKRVPVQLKRTAEGFQHRDGARAGKLPIALEARVVDGDGVGVPFQLNGIGKSCDQLGELLHGGQVGCIQRVGAGGKEGGLRAELITRPRGSSRTSSLPSWISAGQLVDSSARATASIQ